MRLPFVPEGAPSPSGSIGIATVFKVTDHGAVGDGATEDTTAVQAAVAAASAAGGGIVYFPVGVFLLGQISVPSNVHLRGAGWTSVLKMKAAHNLPLLISTDTVNVVVSDLCIDGNKAGQTTNTEAAGIKCIRADRVVLSRLWIKDTEGHSIHLSSVTSIDEGSKVSDVVITDPGSNDLNTWGSCFAATQCEDVQLVNVHALGSAKAGFRLSGSFTLTNCVARRNANGGIVFVSGEARDITVNGGIFADSVGPLSDGIRCFGVERVTLNGVICAGNDGAGVGIYNGNKHISIVGGIFRNNGRHADAPAANAGRDGITIKPETSASTDIIIDGVTCFDDQATKTQDYGISVQTTGEAHIGLVNVVGNELGGLNISSTAPVTVSPSVPDMGHRSHARIETLPRFSALSTTTLTNGVINFAFVTPDVTKLVTQLHIMSGATAGVGMTLVRLGLYEIQGTNLVLVAQTDNDPTLLSATNTFYSKALSTTGGFPASYVMKAGVRYALANIVVGATTAPTARNLNSIAGFLGQEPVMARLRTGQTDLGASFNLAGSGVASNMWWMGAS